MTTQAERAWQLAPEFGDSRAMRMLGWLFFDRGEQSEVRRWFQRALDLGDIPAMRGFSYVLESYGDWPESLRWLREAAERGDPAAMVDWGIQLESMGRLDEAETWFRRGADLGEALAMTDLGYLLARRGDQPGAEEWDRRAAALGQPGAMEHLAQMFQARGQLDEAVAWYRKAAEHAMARIHADPETYTAMARRSLRRGCVPNAILGLGGLLAEMGETAEAEQWFRQTAGRGDARAATALADLCFTRGDLTGAGEWRQKAADLAEANLTRNNRSLLAAYGEDGVQRHVQIMEDYADYLASQDDAAGAARWRLRAEGYRPAGPSRRDHL